MDGEEYPISACTWEQRDQPGIKESNLDESFLVQMPVETATAKRSNEGYITGYDRTKKRFKVDLDGKGILKNFHKPDKNHSWVLLGFGEDEPEAVSASKSGSSSSSSSESDPSASSESDQEQQSEEMDIDSDAGAEATQEMCQPPSDSEE